MNTPSADPPGNGIADIAAGVGAVTAGCAGCAGWVGEEHAAAASAHDVPICLIRDPFERGSSAQLHGRNETPIDELGRDRAAAHLDELARQRQAEPGMACSACGIRAPEPLEHVARIGE